MTIRYLLPTQKSRKMFPKVFFTLSENDEDVASFSVMPTTMVLSVGDLVVATFSIEMSDSSVISSRSIFVVLEPFLVAPGLSAK